ncbi:uncharacterized protein [Misgurnus anguillicaudatus]|uniref:uncharacterized protein isoform X2 n=1 Tax=Misgurnus anguillicaudatus TaxID=75329 RepID=UPI003CCFB0F5
MKMAAPGLSCQAFLRMLDQRTVCFGCTGKISADSFQKRFLALRFKVDNIFKSEEPDIFEGIFIAKDEDITKLVKLSVEEVFVEGSGQQPERPPKNCKQDRRGGIGVVVKWSMAYQDGCGLTLGEEVEQCNAFLSRIPVTTKHISKAGRADMLTLMAMHRHQQTFNNLAISNTRRYQKIRQARDCYLQVLSGAENINFLYRS